MIRHNIFFIFITTQFHCSNIIYNTSVPSTVFQRSVQKGLTSDHLIMKKNSLPSLCFKQFWYTHKSNYYQSIQPCHPKIFIFEKRVLVQLKPLRSAEDLVLLMWNCVFSTLLIMWTKILVFQIFFFNFLTRWM